MPYPYNPYAYTPGIVWVHESEALSYPVAPNSSVLLMDRDKQQFYIKSADASGMPLPLRIFDYKERTSQQGTNPVRGGEYVTKAEFEAFKDEILNGRPEKRPSNESAV